MDTELFQLGVVNAGLALLLILPFLPLSYVLFRGEPWSKILLSAMVIGCSLQSILGVLWSHLVGRWPYGELVVLGVLWLCTIWWCVRRLEVQDEGSPDLSQKQNPLWLIAILFAAFLVRSIHPFEVAYLGQSDAYTHLHYLHNIVDQGRLINPAYPPGYHWILALPVLVFSFDPYMVVRFGGAFFGTGLVLAIYVLLEQLFNRRAALFGSFCAACFPPMTLLMKTGVGAFANQFGLFLLPVIFLFYVLTVSDGKRKTGVVTLLFLALCGLTATVAMMFLHVLLVFGSERFVMLFRAPRVWFRKTSLIVLIILPAIILLMFHVGNVGPGQRFQTANILMEYGGKKQPFSEKIATKVKAEAAQYDPAKKRIVVLIADSPYFKLMLDYLSVKRKGFGNTALNGLGFLLTCIFLSFSVYGFVTKKVNYLIIGLWGGLTSIQAGTGFLQFSSYQREGWSLLVAVCCMSGIFAAQIYQFAHKLKLFLGVTLLSMLVSFTWSVLHPPQHIAIKSSAEDLFIRSIRFLGLESSESSIACSGTNNPLCAMIDLLVEDIPLALVTRRFTGWGNQGEIAPNVLQNNSTLRVITTGKQDLDDIFQPGNQYIVLVDERNSMSSSQIISAFAMVTPVLVQATMRQQNFLFKQNEKIIEYIDKLPNSRWQIQKKSLSANLTAFVVTPTTIRIDK